MANVLMEWEGRLVTTDYIFDEIVTLVRFRVNHMAARKAGDGLRGGDIVVLIEVQGDDINEAWRKFVREHDKAYSFTNCTSFAVMKRLGLTSAVAVDADFRRAGFRMLPR